MHKITLDNIEYNIEAKHFELAHLEAIRLHKESLMTLYFEINNKPYSIDTLARTKTAIISAIEEFTDENSITCKKLENIRLIVECDGFQVISYEDLK